MEQTSTHQFPDILNYFSISEYLKKIYEFRKNENSGFTYDLWSVELGYKSRSFIKMLTMNQRTVTDQFAKNFLKITKFTPNQQTHFELLVKYSQAGTVSDQKIYLDKIFENLGQSKQQTEILNHAEFLSNLMLPKILVLLSFKDLNRTQQGLSDFLKIPMTEMKDHLNQLEKMNLVIHNSVEKTWSANNHSFKIPTDFKNEALKKYHNASLAEAIKAQDLPENQRRYRSTLIALSDEQYENLVSDMNDLVSKAVSKYDSDEIQNKRLYKMNLNIFATTDQFEKQQQLDADT